MGKVHRGMSDDHPFTPVPDFRVDQPELAEHISVGDSVRSYDFEVHPDCYVEGTVLAITDPIEGCSRYRIAVLLRNFDGKQRLGKPGEEIVPPVNGTLNMMGGYTNGVRKVA